MARKPNKNKNHLAFICKLRVPHKKRKDEKIKATDVGNVLTRIIAVYKRISSC